MRLNLYWRGRDVIDVELHLWRMRPDDQPTDDGPTLRANGGGQVERSDTYGDPATIASFGFARTAAPDCLAPAPTRTDREETN